MDYLIGICSTEYIDVESLPNYTEYDYRVCFPKDATNKSVLLFLKGVASKSSCIKVYIDNSFLEDDILRDKIALIENKCVMYNGLQDLMDILNSYSKQDENSYIGNVIESLDLESLVDDAVKASTEMLNATNNELAEQNNSLEEQNRTLTEKVEELKGVLEELKAENGELIKDKEQLDKLYSSVNQQLEQKEEQYNNLENLYKQKSQQLSEQGAMLQALQACNTGLPSDSVDTGSFIDVGDGLPAGYVVAGGEDTANLQQTIDMLELQVAKMSTVEREAEQVKDAYDELSAAYNKVESEKDGLFEQIDALNRKIAGYEAQLAEIKGSQSEDASKVSSLNFELLDLKEQNKSLSDEVKEKLVQISDLEERLNEITVLNERIESLETDLAGEKELAASIEQQRNDLEQSIYPLKSQISEALSRVTQLESEKRDLVQQLNSITTDFAEAQAQGTQNITDKRRLEEDLEVVKGQLQDAKARVAELNTQTISLMEERDTALSDAKTYQAKIDDMTVQLENSMMLQAEVTKLKEELEKVKSSATSGTEYTEMCLKYEALEQKYSELESTSSDKLYKMQTELTEMANIKASLESRLKNVQQGGGGYSPLGKYDSYATNPFMDFNERLSMGEQSRINGLDLSNISVCTVGEGASIAFMSEFTNAWKTWPKNTLIIDLSNNKMCYMGIPSDVRKTMDKDAVKINGTLNIQGMITAAPNVHMFTNDKFNDLSLLTMDYGDFLAQVSAAACGNPVMILLGSLSTFANRVAFVKLASVCKSFIFIHALSTAMFDTVSEIKAIASTFVNCTALVLHSTMRIAGNNQNAQIINESSKTIIKVLSQYVKVHVVPGAIDWVQMGII